ncbi:MAG: hypothetical protein ACE148_13860 [Vicinamibacterales bacterium]
MLATTRLRLGQAFEWSIAVAFLAATVVVALLISAQLGELRSPATAPAPPVVPTDSPPSISGPAVAVPALHFSEAVQVRVGDTLDYVTSMLGPGTVADVDSGSGRLGPRSARSYQYGGARFLLVFEPFERGGTLRVAAIYIR